MDELETAALAGGISNKTHTNFTTNSTQSQRNIILAWLQHSPLTTLQAREVLFIMSPATRIFELKEQGHLIKTFLVNATFGSKKKIAQYVLMPKVVK